jgi:predicted  nucleic acid-binding Zn-ribbon protein
MNDMEKIDDEIKLLVALQDLDLMIREAKDSETSTEMKQMGFKLEGIDVLQEARTNLSKRIRPQLLNRYERLSKSYGRAVVPVTGNLCLGCFSTLPTSYPSLRTKHTLLTCENCGRILYFT